MPLIERLWFLCTTSIGLIVFLVIGWRFRLDPRMADGVIDSTEMTAFENIGLAFSGLAIMFMIISASAHALSNQVKTWRWLNFVVWPCSFVYAWRHYLTRRRSE